MNGKNRLARRVQQLTAAFALALLSSVALAHTALKTSMPADGAVVNQGPDALHLTFTAAVSLVRVNVTDEAGKQLALDFKPGSDRQTDFHVPLPAVPAGSYKVEWAAIGEDGHTVSNSFAYRVDPNAHPSAGHDDGAADHHAHAEEAHEHSDDHHAAHDGDSHAH